jgi:RPA family protein
LENIQRQTAYKVKINQIIQGNYVKNEGWNPNYISFDQKQVSRVNIIGIIVSKADDQSFKNMLLDDGSGRISLRIFNDLSTNAEIGDVVLVVGRPREFSGERYIVPEIIKKIDKDWFQVRKLELAEPELSTVSEEAISESPVENLLNIIRKNDKGDGAGFEDISAEAKDCEQYLNKLLELGEIFEVKPGRYKILE